MQTLPNNPGFEVDDNVVTHPNAVPSQATVMLQIALTALSQRAVVALASLFSVLLAGSVFALYWKVLPEPSINSLVGLGLYSLFIVALHVVRMRK